MTLETVLQRIGSYVDQSVATPTGDDLSIKIALVNRRLRAYGEAFDFDELRTSVTVSGASTGLPTNFKKLATPLYVYYGGGRREYEEISRQDRYSQDADTEFCLVTGGEIGGYALELPNGLLSGASTALEVFTYPSSVATITDTLPISTPEYVIQGVIADILEGRTDSRFPTAQARADQLLAQAIEKENTKRSYSGTNTMRRNTAYRIGRR